MFEKRKENKKRKRKPPALVSALLRPRFSRSPSPPPTSHGPVPYPGKAHGRPGSPARADPLSPLNRWQSGLAFLSLTRGACGTAPPSPSSRRHRPGHCQGGNQPRAESSNPENFGISCYFAPYKASSFAPRIVFPPVLRKASPSRARLDLAELGASRRAPRAPSLCSSAPAKHPSESAVSSFILWSFSFEVWCTEARKPRAPVSFPWRRRAGALEAGRPPPLSPWWIVNCPIEDQGPRLKRTPLLHIFIKSP